MNLVLNAQRIGELIRTEIASSPRSHESDYYRCQPSRLAPAMGHEYGDDMACKRCGVGYAEHQRKPALCRGTKKPTTNCDVSRQNEAGRRRRYRERRLEAGWKRGKATGPDGKRRDVWVRIEEGQA